MDIDSMVMVSVDDHVVEPPDLFEGRLPARYADLAPQFVTKDDGTNAWRYEGAEIGNVALNAVAGRPPEEYGLEPTSLDQLRPGCFDVDEWCGSQPGRFIPCVLPAIWDPEVLAAEVHRTAAKGAHAVTFSENPSKLGWPSLHSDHWDPFWQACSDEGVVVCMHIGSSSSLVIT